MKKNSFSITARVAVGTLFLISGIVVIVLALFTPGSRSATPSSGTINTSGPTLAWDGNAVRTVAANGESTCVENNPHLPGDNCDTFTLTVAGTPAAWAAAGKRIEVKTLAPSGADDYDLVIHKTSNSGPIVD